MKSLIGHKTSKLVGEIFCNQRDFSHLRVTAEERKLTILRLIFVSSLSVKQPANTAVVKQKTVSVIRGSMSQTDGGGNRYLPKEVRLSQCLH